MFEFLLVVFLLVAVLGVLIATNYPTDLIFTSAVAVLVITGILQPSEALIGFTNPGLIVIAVLYVLAAGLRSTGAVSWLSGFFLGNTHELSSIRSRMLVMVMFLSAFVNNSPVVAVFTTSIQSWIKRTNFNISQLLMPLSYAAILGGTCTLIGTSTNLVVDGLLQQSGFEGLGLFDLAFIGIPLCLIGFLYLYFFSERLLPNHPGVEENFEKTREYMVIMKVEKNCELINKTVEDAGLRHLPGLFLIEIVRSGHVFSVVSPATIIESDDKLVFVGAVESVIDLRSIRGLTIDSDQSFKIEGESKERRLFEAVLSAENPAVYKSIRAARFRHRFNAAVLAVARDGKRIDGKVGDIVLMPGDVILLEAHKGFLFKYQYSTEFLLANRLENSQTVEHKKAPLALLITASMVVLNLTGMLSILSAALVAVAAMLLFGCISIEDARKSIDYKLLLTICMAFGLGVAIQKVGIADAVAQFSIDVSDSDPLILLIMIYLATMILTELVTNNAAAIVMFPVAVSTSSSIEASIIPFSITVMIAASASFVTPIGYQTNLMVQGPGGYHYNNYVKFGSPLSLLVFITTIVIVPVVWPF